MGSEWKFNNEHLIDALRYSFAYCEADSKRFHKIFKETTKMKEGSELLRTMINKELMKYVSFVANEPTLTPTIIQITAWFKFSNDIQAILICLYDRNRDTLYDFRIKEVLHNDQQKPLSYKASEINDVLNNIRKLAIKELKNHYNICEVFGIKADDKNYSKILDTLSDDLFKMVESGTDENELSDTINLTKKVIDSHKEEKECASITDVDKILNKVWNRAADVKQIIDNNDEMLNYRVGKSVHQRCDSMRSDIEEAQALLKHLSEETFTMEEVLGALLEKGQKSTRYKLGETFELNFLEITQAIQALADSKKEKEGVSK